MPFKLPLCHNDLRAIRERQPWNTDVISLLWKVKRLRATLLRAYLYDEFMAALHAEPCVIEHDHDVCQLMEEPAKLRKGLMPR
jgi:hypothetical protein